MRDPLERLFELYENALLRVLLDRRRGLLAQPPSKLLIPEIAADRLAERRGVAERNEQAVLTVLHDFTGGADGGSPYANLILDASLAYEMMTFGTEDQKEAARAFVEKRKPNYVGH